MSKRSHLEALCRLADEPAENRQELRGWCQRAIKILSESVASNSQPAQLMLAAVAIRAAQAKAVSHGGIVSAEFGTEVVRRAIDQISDCMDWCDSPEQSPLEELCQHLTDRYEGLLRALAKRKFPVDVRTLLDECYDEPVQLETVRRHLRELTNTLMEYPEYGFSLERVKSSGAHRYQIVESHSLYDADKKRMKNG